MRTGVARTLPHGPHGDRTGRSVPEDRSVGGGGEKGGWRELLHPEAWRKVAERLRARLAATSPALRLLAALDVLFILLVSYLSLLRYNGLLDPIVDTGEYNQAMYNTLYNHELLYCPWEWLGPQGSFLGIHFSPLLFALMPFYAPFPTAATLLVFQAIALGLAAFPLFALARDHLGSEHAALGIAVAYFVVPATLSGTWGGFHLEAFLPWFLLSSFHAATRRAWRTYFAWFLATLCVIETIAPFLLVFGFFWALQRWTTRPWRWGIRGDRERQVALLSMVVAGGWLLLADWVMGFFTPYGGFVGGSASFAWVVLGSNTGSGVFLQALLHPSAAWNALMFQGGLKVLYVLVLFASFAFIPVFGAWRYLLPAVAWIALAALSDWSAFYTLGIMYLYYPLPFLLAATVDGTRRAGQGLERLRAWLLHRLRRPAGTGEVFSLARSGIVASVLVAALATSATVGVLAPGAPTPLYFPQIGTGWPVITDHQNELAQVAALVPSNAYIATTHDVLTMVSSSDKAYILPIRVPPGVNDSNFNATLGPVVRTDVDQAQYVLIDYSNPANLLPAAFLYQYANLTGFGVRAAVDGIYLYERAWSGPPQFWRPMAQTASAASVAPGNAALWPTGGPGGSPALVHASGLQNGTTFWTSNANIFPTDLAPGVYRISVQLGVQTRQLGTQLQVEIFADYPVLMVGPTAIGGKNVSNYRGNFTVDRWVTAPVGSLTLTSPQAGAFNWTGNLSATLVWTTPGAWLSDAWIISPELQAELFSIQFVQVSSGVPPR